MPSALVQVADAVTAALNGHDFGLQFEAERSYADWDLELKEAECLRVDVVPVEHSRSDLDDLGATVYDCAVDVGIRRKFGHGEQDVTDGRIDKTKVDRLVFLVEQIHDFFCAEARRELADNMNWRGTVIRTSYVREHLKDWRQFTGIMRITYEFHREL